MTLPDNTDPWMPATAAQRYSLCSTPDHPLPRYQTRQQFLFGLTYERNGRTYIDDTCQASWVIYGTKQHEGHGFCRAAQAWINEGFRARVKTPFPNPVPQGRLNLAQDASPGLDLKGRPVPQGRLKIGRDAILDNLQPSLRDSIMFHDVPRTSVLG